MGGLEGNTKAEVLDTSGKPINGLFASGEVGEFSVITHFSPFRTLANLVAL